jgi:hypothetical protein
MNFIGKIYEISLGRKSIRTEGFQNPSLVSLQSRPDFPQQLTIVSFVTFIYNKMCICINII